MMSLDQWAERWGVPPVALQELSRSVLHHGQDSETLKSESRVLSEVRLEAARSDFYMFRNNSGAGKMESGNFVRFGLGNDSKQLNQVFKSGDLVGVKRRLITPEMVGSHIGQFISREVKHSTWKFSGTIDEAAQLRWATLINEQGGDARFVTGPGSFAT